MNRLRATLGRVLHRATLPYASLAAVPAGASVSDLFLLRADGAGCRFVAENTLALLTGKPVEVLHRLRIFDADGSPLRTIERLSRSCFTTIDLDDVPAEPGASLLELGTFVHSTHYDLGELDADGAELLSLQRLHRGYCQYRRTPQSVWSSVHGNFGGVISEADPGRTGQRLLARRRAPFLYTPQYRFRAGEPASLFFLNACAGPERVEILRAPELEDEPPRLLERVVVPSLGVRRVRLAGHGGYLSFRSRLPMCRPIVFLEPIDQPQHFDVFHT